MSTLAPIHTNTGVLPDQFVTETECALCLDPLKKQLIEPKDRGEATKRIATVSCHLISNPLASLDESTSTTLLYEDLVTHGKDGVKHPFHASCWQKFLKEGERPSTCPTCQETIKNPHSMHRFVPAGIDPKNIVVEFHQATNRIEFLRERNPARELEAVLVRPPRRDVCISLISLTLIVVGILTFLGGTIWLGINRHSLEGAALMCVGAVLGLGSWGVFHRTLSRHGLTERNQIDV